MCTISAGQGMEAAWKLEGVKQPHDLAVVAGPVRLMGSEHPLAVLVTDTRETGSQLHKFILWPEGALEGLSFSVIDKYRLCCSSYELS